MDNPTRKRPIFLVRPTDEEATALDAYNDPVDDEDGRIATWARRMDAIGSEARQASTEKAALPITLRIRYRADLREDWTVEEREGPAGPDQVIHRYDIKSISEIGVRHWQDLVVERRR